LELTEKRGVLVFAQLIPESPFCFNGIAPILDKSSVDRGITSPKQIRSEFLIPSLRWEEAKSCPRRFHAGSAMGKGECRAHYHRARELPEEFLRTRPAMSVVEKAGYGKSKDFSPTGLHPIRQNPQGWFL